MSLTRNAIANFLGQGWSALMGLAFLPVYIKYLGIEAYALIGVFAMISTWLSLFDFGMTQTLGREMSKYTGGSCDGGSIRDLLRTIESLMVAIVMALMGAFVFSADWIALRWLNASALDGGEASRAVAVMGVVIALRFLENIYRACLLGLQHHVAYNIVNCVMMTLRWFGAVVVIVWVDRSITSFFIWQGTVAVGAIVLLAVLTYQALPADRRGRFSVHAVRDIRRFAGGMFAVSILSLMLTQIDKLLLSRLLSLADFGYYTLASTVAGGIFLLTTPIVQTFYPRLCQQFAAEDGFGFSETFLKASKLVNVLAGTAAIILILHAQSLMLLWTRNAELTKQTTLLLSVLGLGNLLNALMLMPYQATLAHGWVGFGVKVNIVAIAVLVPAVILVAPAYGTLGVACLWVALNAGYLLIATSYLFRNLLAEQKREWAQGILATVLGGFAIGLLFHFSEMLVAGNPIAQMLGIIAATMAVFLYTVRVNGLHLFKRGVGVQG